MTKLRIPPHRISNRNPAKTTSRRDRSTPMVPNNTISAIIICTTISNKEKTGRDI
jgi:hypothetical protein